MDTDETETINKLRDEIHNLQDELNKTKDHLTPLDILNADRKSRRL